MHSSQRDVSRSSFAKSVAPVVSTRRVWVYSRPLGSRMVTMMLAVMTSTFIFVAP